MLSTRRSPDEFSGRTHAAAPVSPRVWCDKLVVYRSTCITFLQSRHKMGYFGNMRFPTVETFREPCREPSHRSAPLPTSSPVLQQSSLGIAYKKSVHHAAKRPDTIVSCGTGGELKHVPCATWTRDACSKSLFAELFSRVFLTRCSRPAVVSRGVIGCHGLCQGSPRGTGKDRSGY